ncbi:MAG: hypothetical protein IPP72_12915 [Chitinophagaceae bacterium]|nr:hypothetical protein [Chitinophagaceae bacterium]
MVRPTAGELIRSRWAVVIRGGNNPLLVELTSSTADALGVLVPTPTCAFAATVINSAAADKI